MHGPHQLAQKSTTTGVSACMTSFSKLSNVTIVMFVTSLFIIRIPRCCPVYALGNQTVADGLRSGGFVHGEQ